MFAAPTTLAASALHDDGMNLATQHPFGIGWSNPTASQVMLDVRTDTQSVDPLDLAKYVSTVGGNKLNLVRGRGTVAAPQPDLIGDYIVQLQSWGYSPGPPSNGNAAEIISFVDNTVGTSVLPQAWSFWHNDTSGTERERFRIDSSGHVSAPADRRIPGSAASAVPTLSTCGTGAVISGSDVTGTITLGTAATGCTITFFAAWSSTTPTAEPHCTLTSRAGLAFVYDVSSTAITVTSASALAGTKLDYTCLGS